MIDSLKRLVQNQHWERPTANQQLKDRQSGVKVNIKGLPDNRFILCVPEGGGVHATTLINRQISGFTESCDFLVFCPNAGNIDVYFVEIKNSLKLDGNGVPEKGCNQILHTVPLLEYLISMVKTHFRKEPKVNRHYTVIAEKKSTRLDKQRVKPDKITKCRYQGEDFQIIHSTPTVRLKDLGG